MYFHKETLLSAYNKYFYTEPERKISRSIFDNYFKCDTRRLNGKFNVRFGGENDEKVVRNLIDIDITPMPELLEFADLSKSVLENLLNEKYIERNIL